MVLPQPKPSEIKEFQQLYLKHNGVELTDEQASEYARRALQLVYLSIYCQPYKRKDGAEGRNR